MRFYMDYFVTTRGGGLLFTQGWGTWQKMFWRCFRFEFFLFMAHNTLRGTPRRAALGPPGPPGGSIPGPRKSLTGPPSRAAPRSRSVELCLQNTWATAPPPILPPHLCPGVPSHAYPQSSAFNKIFAMFCARTERWNVFFYTSFAGGFQVYLAYCKWHCGTHFK